VKNGVFARREAARESFIVWLCMSVASDRIFRAAALERLSSPDQLDQLIEVTRPADWAAAWVIGLCLGAVIIWSVIGRVPTRVAGEGILVSDAGRVVDAVSAVGGRLAKVDVAVGDHVTVGQPIAHIVQTETEQRFHNAQEVVDERGREHDEFAATVKRELEIKAADAAAQKSGLEEIIAASKERVTYLQASVANLEGLVAKGYVARRDLEDQRSELATTQQRITTSRNEMLRIDGGLQEAQIQRETELLASQFKVNDARRQKDQLEGTLERDSQIKSPIDGQVLEIKVSAGAVLAAGTPLVAIESEVTSLQAIIYVPAEHGKNVQPGMEVRIEPNTFKREEFGTMIGIVAGISAFPVTPEGMAAVLHNEALVKRFSQGGAPYAVMVRLLRDPIASSGYRWSSGHGPPFRLTTGTLARAEVTTREQPPIDLVLPVMRRFTGIED
jgi:HlyD family secretion protein